MSKRARQDSEQPQPSKRARLETGKSLFVRSLPPSATDQSLTDFFSQHFPVKNALVVTDPATKTSRGYGFVVFTDPQDAADAKERLHRQKFDGRPIDIDIAKARDRKSALGPARKGERHAALHQERKPPKLIVRNLPWSIKKPDQLAALFRSHGKIYYCDLPQSKGKLSGFGFVTMKRKGAERALDAVNGKVVDGRTLAVDWAVSKQEWTHQQQDLPWPQDATTAPQASTEGPADQDAEHANEDTDADHDEDEDVRNFIRNFGDRLEDEDENEDADKLAGDEWESSEENEDEFGGQREQEGNEGRDTKENTKGPAPPKPLVTDNKSTLFVRNLPFSTTDVELKNHFQQFGRVRYARVVMDRATDRSAGTGFVNFVTIDDAVACLRGAPHSHLLSDGSGKRSILQNESADQQGSYTLDGRVLQLSQAVGKEEAAKLAADGIAARGGRDQDKRRLYLLSEGAISPGSPLYAFLAPSEVKMREESTSQRKKQIQSNPSLHLSLNRLAIRNIPRNLTSKDLKAIAREAVVGFAKDVKEGRRQPLSKEEVARGGDGERNAEHKRREKRKGIVKQAKIVYENKEGSKVAESDGAGRSRGYGFIEYFSHRSALMGLRWLNGHAVKSNSGKPQRLIVEFAIENAQVVARRNDRETQPVKQREGGRPPAKGGSPPGRHAGARHLPADKGRIGRGEAAHHVVAEVEGDGAKKSAVRNVLEQKIIGRKRTLRKKKASTRRRS